jgi:hypothetical protein
LLEIEWLERLLRTVDKTKHFSTLIDNCQASAQAARLLSDVCKDEERLFKSISLYNLASSANSFKLVRP